MRIMGAGVKGGTQIEEEAFPSPPLDVGADRSLTAPCRDSPHSLLSPLVTLTPASHINSLLFRHHLWESGFMWSLLAESPEYI